MRLFESSFDGDVEDVKCILDTGVPVDVQDPVRQCIYLSIEIKICCVCIIIVMPGFRFPYVTVHAKRILHCKIINSVRSIVAYLLYTLVTAASSASLCYMYNYKLLLPVEVFFALFVRQIHI